MTGFYNPDRIPRKAALISAEGQNRRPTIQRLGWIGAIYPNAVMAFYPTVSLSSREAVTLSPAPFVSCL